jgi:galactokinase
LTPQESAHELFKLRFGCEPDLMVGAPGRVNLIGEHTDYNDGFVMPMAIEQATWLALRAREDRSVRVASVGHPDIDFQLDSMEPGTGSWAEYLKGVAWALDGWLSGWEGALATDIPIGAGLSSSAALEIATALAFVSVSNQTWEPKAAALACRRAENEWVGVGSGIMDQLIVATAEAGHASLIDCRSLEIKNTPLPEDIAVLILDTGTRRQLVTSEYDQRLASCRRAAAAAGVPALRDLAPPDLTVLVDRVDETTFRRARHVVTENARTREAAIVLQAGDTDRFGELMSQSHRSLRDDYEVSTDALEAIVAMASEIVGCIGARMTGAGFGGCAVALVHDEATADFIDQVTHRYLAATGISPVLYTTKAAAGARLFQTGAQET